MSFDLTLKTAFQFWAQLDCPTSLKLKLLAEAGMWAEVLTVKVEPEHFACPLEYAKANAAVCFLKKCPDVPGATEEERKRKAIETWEAGEASCYFANQRLSPYLISPLSDEIPAKFLRGVRRILLSWLRHAPDDDELKLRARHGPGATFSSSVANPTAADKYSDSMTLTPGAKFNLLNLAGTKWMGLMTDRFVKSQGDSINFVPGNRFAVVPKTALTHRSIGIEPTLNIYFQLAVGSSIRARMRKYAGWDLDNAADVHRKVAQQASIDGQFATVDLSNASDTLCKNLVRILLRDTSWLPILEDLRSPKTRIDGKWRLLEKFSSMGNGYTFELESCVFAAIAAQCLLLRGIEPKLGKNLFVFGDDIIVPTEAARLVVDTLEWCGFKANKEKTFLHGSFRESCGGDFFSGYPVRGFYLKDALTKANHQRTFTVHNGVRKVLNQCGINSPWFLNWIRSMLPMGLRDLGGPERLGDTVLHGLPQTFRWRHGVRWVRAACWSKPILIKWSYFSEEARLACRLTGYGDTFGINSRGARVCSELVWVTDS